VNAPRRREGVRRLRDQGLSERQACRLVEVSRSTARYRPHPRDDAPLAERLRKITRRKPRYGYRRAWATLRRAGERINHKRVYRVWRKEGLSLKNRRRRKRARSGASVPCQATRPHQVWTYDFIHDACISGRKLKLLTVVDEFTRECLAIEVGTSIRAGQVIEVLQPLFEHRGRPEFLRSDNGPEFVAHQLKAWLAEAGTQTHYIEPGSPWQNGFGESFHSRLRDECLNAEVFANLAEARVVIELWRREYNEERPHSSLGYRTPAEFRAAWEAQSHAGENDRRLGLSLWGRTDADNYQGQTPRTRDLPPSVPPPAAALGSLPSVALSSERATVSVP
jgi:putative transposase